MNYLNSRSAQGPRNGNHFNTPQDEDIDLWPGGTGNLFNGPIAPARYPVDDTLYSSGDDGGSDDAMPVFRSGEAREAPADAVQPVRRENVAEAPEAAPARGDDEAAEIARENQMEELHPFTNVPDGPAFPYLKTMTGRTNQEIADITQAQYPGSTVRVGRSGRPIIKMPEGATRLEQRPATSLGDGPDYELVEVPIGGQEFQLNAPGLSMRDVANGGGQEVIKSGRALQQAARGAKAGFFATESPVGALVGALVGGAKGYLDGDQAIAYLARKFKSE